MPNPLDELQVAKLAASISGQLRDMDSRTDGSAIAANRIDTRKFIKNVVSAANPNVPRPEPSYNTANAEEARLLEMLNQQAISQVPDVSLNSPKPELIPMPTTNTMLVPTPTTIPQPNMVTTQPFNYVQITPESQNIDPILQIAISVKNIDESLQKLCNHFIVVAKKKKRKKPQRNKTNPTNPAVILETTNETKQSTEIPNNVE